MLDVWNDYIDCKYIKIGGDVMVRFKEKVKKIANLVPTTLMLASTNVLASNDKISGTVGTEEVTTATENLKRVITSIAIPLGSIIIFASIVITALRMIINSNNPNKRSETIGSIAWTFVSCCWNYFKCRNKWNRTNGLRRIRT